MQLVDTFEHGYITLEDFKIIKQITKLRPKTELERFAGGLYVKTEEQGYIPIREFLEMITKNEST